MARFALAGVPSAAHLVRRFSADAKGLFAGVSSHAMMALNTPLTAAVGIFLTVAAHAGGWPLVEGGSGVLMNALVSEFEDAGGTVRTGEWIRSMNELPRSRVTLFDTSPQTLVAVAGKHLSSRYVNAVSRFRNGPGVFKVDWALSGPVPWSAEECRRTATVHLGGTFEEVASAEADVARGRHSEKPFCIVVQPSVVDASRAPAGHATLWAYCHVPNGSTVDMTSRIEAQIERFAPGFGDLVLARSTINAAQSEQLNPNYVGGDINGGAGTLRQTFLRPTMRWNPYRTGSQGLYLCSSATPPGGGVHGMCGVGAARAVLQDLKHGSFR
jgi:phytoene dehydrogenase-like protein